MLTTMLSLLALTAASVQPAPVFPEPAARPDAPAALIDAVPDKRVYVALVTDAGTMVVRLETERAPVTAGNFLRYVDSKRLQGFQFYRSTRNWGEHSQIVQAGNRGDARLNYPPIAHEPTTKTGLTHCKGALSMARLNPGDATTDFFLLLSDIPGFDADPARSGDNAGFAVFGELVAGQDVARKIFEGPISSTDGTGVMQGQMLDPKITIRTASRVAAPKNAPESCILKGQSAPQIDGDGEKQ